MAQTIDYKDMVAKAKAEWYTWSMKKVDLEKHFLWWLPEQAIWKAPTQWNLLTDVSNSKTIDNFNRSILPLNADIIEKIWTTIKKHSFEMKYFLDQDEIWYKNFDLPISLLHIYNYFRWEVLDESVFNTVRELISEKFWLWIYNWLDRGQTIKAFANMVWFEVFSFPLQSDLHDTVMSLWLPYEITLWIDDEFVSDSYSWEVSKDKYWMTTSKSYVWYNKNTSDTLNIINTYWKRLDKNSFEITKPTELLNNFNMSSVWYVFFPKMYLTDDDKNFIKLNQSLSVSAQSAMRRGMWDWKDPQWFATKDYVAAYVLNLKQKHKI